jgi:LEA14-like dessication related protein
MNRLEGAFAAVVVSSVLLGGIVAADASDSFRTVDLAGTVGSQADVEVTGTTIREDRLLVIAAVENPTRYRLELTGVFLQTFANESRLAYGSASFADPVVIPARSTERVRYSVQFSPDGLARLRAAGTGAGGVELRTRYSLQLGETTFVLRSTDRLEELGGASA